VNPKLHKASASLKLPVEECEDFVFTGRVENRAFKAKSEQIYILHKNGEVHHIDEDAALLNISVLSEPVVKHFICFPG
jgi:hypothetical protein